MTTDTDFLGNPVTGATGISLHHYMTAIGELQRYQGDPLQTIAEALDGAPRFAMARLLAAWAHLLSTEPQAPAAVETLFADCLALPLNARERAHLAAAQAFACGRWQLASQLLEKLSAAWPRDPLALHAGHLCDFLRGDSERLQARIGRALPHWTDEDPGYHALLGMYAFGCEETGDYRAAERYGRQALELEPRDGWAHHAVAHVFEMEGRCREGIDWMSQRESLWSSNSFLAIHNAWHWALFHLAQGNSAEALAVFDQRMAGGTSTVTVDLIDASSLLWRLSRLGVDVGARWQAVAEGWAAVGVPGLYAFNDFHAMMAWASTGDERRMSAWLAAQTDTGAHATGDHAEISSTIGAPLLEALAA